MDSTISMIILPMLKQLRETKHGIPTEFAPQQHFDQMCFPFIEEDNQRQWDEKIGENKWNAVLDAMIWSFQEVVDGRYHSPIIPIHMGKEYDAYMSRIQTGFDYFGKYFGNLWD